MPNHLYSYRYLHIAALTSSCARKKLHNHSTQLISGSKHKYIFAYYKSRCKCSWISMNVCKNQYQKLLATLTVELVLASIRSNKSSQNLGTIPTSGPCPIMLQYTKNSNTLQFEFRTQRVRPTIDNTYLRTYMPTCKSNHIQLYVHMGENFRTNFFLGGKSASVHVNFMQVFICV